MEERVRHGLTVSQGMAGDVLPGHGIVENRPPRADQAGERRDSLQTSQLLEQLPLVACGPAAEPAHGDEEEGRLSVQLDHSQD